MGVAAAAVGEGVVSGNDEELIVNDEYGTPRHAKRQGIVDAGSKSKASRSGTIMGNSPLDEGAEIISPRAPRRAERKIQLQPVFVSDRRIARIALIPVNRYQREPRPEAKSDAALNKVLIQVRGSFIQPFIEFDFQRLIGRKVGGDSLVEPKPYLFIVLGILGQRSLLCSCRNG